MAQPAVDLYVLSGFLGSGKTTLLGHLLRHSDFSDTAVIVNEFGEVGLDHDLLESARDDVVVLPGGCICCAIREDLASTIRRLIERRDTGRLRPFRRIVIETSGVADPVPVIFTLRTDPRIRQACSLRGLIVTVDAQNALQTFEHQIESVRQVALADRIVITKTDLVDDDIVSSVSQAVAQLNPSASLLTAAAGAISPALLLRDLEHEPQRGDGGAGMWLGELRPAETPPAAGFTVAGHSARYRSISWRRSGQIDWSSFGIWLTMLLHAHGDRVLRVKGILQIEGAVGPVAIHGVQHTVHPPVHLQSGAGAARESRLVFVISGVSETSICESLDAFLTLTNAARGSTPASIRPGSCGGIIGGRPVRRPMAPAWLKG